MWTPIATDADPHHEDSHHLGARLAQLNARIARLAIALNVDLDSDAQVQTLLQRPPEPSIERRQGTERRRTERTGSPDRRVSLKRTELRGLVVMRYALELHTIDVLGTTVALALMRSVALSLESEGFPIAASGQRRHLLALPGGL
ncbi:hypothetical protein KAK06_03800 [Ideonella sp. 4Y11]|uniref:Uncharacterized protein n=1 Tax=Ideonella aquatica TaxID=2824119 RepID=A0A940YLA9_9BURK|nr:hypothetical protein [Ideonella aquatica]MBQ0958073.1 hypothetical protein [Ideonella aquatica]